MTSNQTASLAATWNDHAYKILAGAAFGLLATGTIVYRVLEDWSWVDSLYFSTVAVTTVGFGDLSPSSDASKLFTVVYILVGLAIITTYLNATLNRRATRRMGSSTLTVRPQITRTERHTD